MENEQGRHRSIPPTVLMNRSIIAPSAELPHRADLRSLGRPLAFDQLLEVDPLSLWLCEQCTSGLRREVANDDTIIPKSVRVL